MKKIIIVSTVILLSIVAGLLWWNRGMAAVNTQDKHEEVFVIRKGAGLREIANDLKEKGLIVDPTVFFLYVKKEGKDTEIQYGSFRLSPSMSAKEIAENLTHGTFDMWVTFKEGIRAEEVADILQQEFPQFEPSWRTELIKEEGFLFPDTYLVPKDATVETIIQVMKDNFYKRTVELGLEKDSAEEKNAVIIASLIEREARYDNDMGLVSSVIHNRLADGMSLDIDATLQYAIGKGHKGGTWWKIPEGVDTKLESPYNTYRNPGLPPTPISNPGLRALKAAVNPAESEYYFYVSDENGHLHFAKTLAEHNQNIEKYLNN